MADSIGKAGFGSSVRLLEIEPDLSRFLTADEREDAEQLLTPVRVVPKGLLDLNAMLDELGAFGGLLLEGMVLQQLQVGDQATLRLLGPGDILSLSGSPGSMLVAETECRAAVSTRMAILGNELLLAMRRWPRLVAGLHVRMAEQTERLSVQLAICQLPRVDQRLLSIMWLLAEWWGQVTPSGTTLPLSLTHDALGGLIGARRPTVTLALGELSGRGAIVRQNEGWLLLERPAIHVPTNKHARPAILPIGASPWSVGPPHPEDPEVTYAAVREAVRRLREHHEAEKERIRDQLARMRTSRIRARMLRERLSQDSVSHRRAPSS